MPKIAIVQASSVYLDRAASVAKACEFIARAGGAGAELTVFGESFVPGHTLWAHIMGGTDPRSISLATRLVQNAVTIPGPEADALAQAARAASSMVVVGVVERPDPNLSAIYSSQLVISAAGEILGVRRKLVPAVGERIFLTAGGVEDIRTFPSPWGPLSALIAGENANPLLTFALRETGARIHVASWPAHFNKRGIMQETMRITGSAVAYQNSAWVLAAATMSDDATIDLIPGSDEDKKRLIDMAADRGSMVFAPRGRISAGPGPDGEGILYADLDLDAASWPQLVNRQYDRPDLLRLVIDRRQHGRSIEVIDGAVPAHVPTPPPESCGPVEGS